MSDELIPRDHHLERYLTDLAARAHGHPNDYGLRAAADARSWSGGVRPGIDWDEECAQELIDAAAYLAFGIQPIYAAALAGDSDACRLYERRMRALGYVIDAWHALHTDAS